MALDAEEKLYQALARAYEVMSDTQLFQSLANDIDRYRRSGDTVPEEPDRTVLLRFRAALRKTTQPAGYLQILVDYYKETKDFRFLETVPDAVIGHTAARIYDALAAMRSGLELIGDEAAVNRVAQHLAQRRDEVETDVDRRALSLLEFLVERRAGDLAHGAGPHVAAAIAALRSAFKGKWAAGEPLLMARFLEAGTTPTEREVPCPDHSPSPQQPTASPWGPMGAAKHPSP